MHPNGSSYLWTSDKTLLEVDADSLPVLPPALVPHLQMLLGGDVKQEYGKVSSGRNSALSEKLGSLLNENKTVDRILVDLVKFDEESNEVPYFSDENEHQHGHALTNALSFYTSHLSSINSRRFRESKEYLSPVMSATNEVDLEKIKEAAGKKSLSKGSQKKSKAEYLLAGTVLKQVHETMLKNSWIKQPELALGATLALFSTLTSRKFVFQGISPNLYICNISESGTGKDAPQQFVKQVLAELGKENLLGAGDYVSDASLMDSLGVKPVRLDIMDEVGGILKTITSGKSEYNSKMADVLAELYTTSNSRYLGRATAEGVKGAQDRPNVNILGSTTPTGFREGVSKTAIEKGLLGRFLLFQGDPTHKASRVKRKYKYPQTALNQMFFLSSYSPEESDFSIQGKQQLVTELEADDIADKRLDEIFEEFDQFRRDNILTPAAPIIARLYQQMIKLIIIHSTANSGREVNKINLQDVEFGYNVIKAYFEEINGIISGLIFDSKVEQDRQQLLSVIKTYGAITRKDLTINTPSLTKAKRDMILEDLMDIELIKRTVETEGNKRQVVYYVGDYE